MTTLLNFFVIDLIAVKAFIVVVAAISAIDAVALLLQVVRSMSYPERVHCAFWLGARSFIVMMAIVILYSNALEVQVQ